MDQVDVVAVVGSCAPERHRYALRLASATRRMLIPSARLEHEADPAHAAAILAPWSDQPDGTVIEYPATTAAAEIIGACADPESPTRLLGLICVVDAPHLIDDLSVDDFLVSERDARGRPVDHVARASLTVSQLEYASTIVLVNWENLTTPELSTTMALVSSLSPRARLRLDRSGIGSPATETPETKDTAMRPAQDRAGWMEVLNGTSDPRMSDPRVSTVRYEQLRPFHPERLADVLMRRFDTGEFGQVIRSAGFCRLATRPATVLQWDHVGRMIAFHLLAADDRLGTRIAADGGAHEALRGDEPMESFAIGQELAFIGLDLDANALHDVLDSAALTDDELTAGPAAWARYPDPFPAHEPADDAAP